MFRASRGFASNDAANGQGIALEVDPAGKWPCQPLYAEAVAP